MCVAALRESLLKEAKVQLAEALPLAILLLHVRATARLALDAPHLHVTCQRIRELDREQERQSGQRAQQPRRVRLQGSAATERSAVVEHDGETVRHRIAETVDGARRRQRAPTRIRELDEAELRSAPVQRQRAPVLAQNQHVLGQAVPVEAQHRRAAHQFERIQQDVGPGLRQPRRARQLRAVALVQDDPTVPGAIPPGREAREAARAGPSAPQVVPREQRHGGAAAAQRRHHFPRPQPHHNEQPRGGDEQGQQQPCRRLGGPCASLRRAGQLWVGRQQEDAVGLTRGALLRERPQPLQKDLGGLAAHREALEGKPGRLRPRRCQRCGRFARATADQVHGVPPRLRHVCNGQRQGITDPAKSPLVTLRCRNLPGNRQRILPGPAAPAPMGCLGLNVGDAAQEIERMLHERQRVVRAVRRLHHDQGAVGERPGVRGAEGQVHEELGAAGRVDREAIRLEHA
mmetsp:Transcript_132319/g.423339  ORF Transcript_132319/g.423339 Transcript_132319/m.423339 type:complete len:460 (-) Transcript_132319:327-1706(-)